MSLEELIYANLLDSANRVAIPEPTASQTTLQHVPAVKGTAAGSKKRGAAAAGESSSGGGSARKRARKQQLGALSTTKSSSNDNEKRRGKRKRGNGDPTPPPPAVAKGGLGLPTLRLEGLFDSTNHPHASDTSFVYPVDPAARRVGGVNGTTTTSSDVNADSNNSQQRTKSRQCSKKQRTNTIARWKGRRVDLREAVDVGNAFATRVRILHQLGLMSTTAKDDDDAVEQVKDEDDDDDDSSSSSSSSSGTSSGSGTSNGSGSDSSPLLPHHSHSSNNENEDAEDLDLMKELMKARPNKKQKVAAKEPESFWELGYTGPRGYSSSFSSLLLPHVDLSAKATVAVSKVITSAVSSSSDGNDNKDDEDDDGSMVEHENYNETLALRSDPRRRMADRDYVAAALPFPLMYSHMDDAFVSARAYLGNPSHVLRVVAIRYGSGRNAAMSKPEQVRTVSLLWRLYHAPAKWHVGPQKEWDFRRLQHFEARQLGETVMKAMRLHNNQNNSKTREEPNEEEEDDNFRIDIRTTTSLLCKSQPNSKFLPATDPIDHGTYVFLPGTCPPVPSLPLDWLGLTWGGVDRYNNVHHRTKYPDYIYKLSYSILVADRNPVKQWRFFRHCLALVEFEMRRIIGQHAGEVPNAALANAIRFTLAIWDEAAANENDHNAHQSRNDVTKNSNSNNDCLGWLKKVCDSKNLLMMRDLQLTCALMDIAANFTNDSNNYEAVTEILSRDPATCNPITMLREIVEDYEPNSAAAMEYCAHSHAKRTFVERNATDPIEHAWYVSFLATSLVMSEGNASFLATRVALAQALQLLYQLHRLSPSEQSRTTLKALGNWDRAWRLLLTGSSDGNGQLRPVLKHDDHIGAGSAGHAAFEVAARALESDPSLIASWRKVEQVLGPVSPRRLDPSLTAQYDYWDLRDRDWWYGTFLKPMDQVEPDAPFLQHKSLPLVDEGEEIKMPVNLRKHNRIVQTPEFDTKWLDVLIQQLQEYKTDADDHFDDSSDDEEEEEESDDGLVPLPRFTTKNHELEFLTYKVLLLAHFRAIDHVDVGSTLLLLISKAWEEDAIGENGVTSLQWLQTMGIVVCESYQSALLRHKETTAKEKNRRSRRRAIRTKDPGKALNRRRSQRRKTSIV
jgi:hypothetical protein